MKVLLRPTQARAMVFFSQEVDLKEKWMAEFNEKLNVDEDFDSASLVVDSKPFVGSVLREDGFSDSDGSESYDSLSAVREEFIAISAEREEADLLMGNKLKVVPFKENQNANFKGQEFFSGSYFH
jgi:hypothetical protein